MVAFRRTVAHKVAVQCAGFDVYDVGSSERLIGELINSGVLDKYDCIVALGLKNRSKDYYVHVESVCFDVEGKVISLQANLADNADFKVTRVSRNQSGSFCNILAAGLSQKYKHKKISFLHIPPKIYVPTIANSLRERLGVIYGQDASP